MTDSVSGTDLGPDSSQYVTQSHSFKGYSSGTMADIAARVVSEFACENDDYFDDHVLYWNDVGLEETIPEKQNEEEQEGDGDSDFEFVVPGAEENSSPISAGEIFINGQIKPLFPLFNTDLVFGNAEWNSNLQIDSENQSVSHQPSTEDKSNSSDTSAAIRLPLKKLLLSERETSLAASASCSEDEADDLEGVNSETYCVWTPPKQEMSKKSNSTGSSKRWKLRNLVHRSHSDGREKFVFLTPKQEEEQRRLSASEKPEISSRNTVERSSSGGGKRKEEKAQSTTSAAVGKAHWDHYLRNRAIKESDRRKSYLPYKQDLVGFFTNVNSLSRTMQPF
ncbi:hypothetical protein V2J09_014996 [Rumex salicifolius]